MNDALRTLCVSKGMKTDATDDEAQRFLVEQLGKPTESPPPAKEGERQAPEDLPTADKLAKLIGEAVRAVTNEEKVRADTFRKDVDGLIEISGIDCKDAQRSEFYRLDSIDKVRGAIIEAKKKAEAEIPGGFGPERIQWTGNGREEQRSDMTTSVVMRALGRATKETVDKIFPVATRGKHPENFDGAGIFDIARECLHLDGVRTRGLNREQIAMAALGFGAQAGVRGAFDPAYHDTGSFLKLTQDAINKSMMKGYTECPMTWDRVFGRGASANDFKTIHRIRLGAVPNLPDWASNVDPDAVSLADAEETYRVQAKSLQISFSYQLLVNDDMSVLSRIPGMFGAAAARTVNAVAWAQITGNPTMGDGVALFSGVSGARKRANTTTGVNVPSVANLQTLKNLMRQMRGENTPEGNESLDILNLQPRFIVGPGALETKIKQLVMSAYDPAASQFQTYNTATELEPVIEPLLDVNSAVAWYVMADTSQIDTVEVTFLTGHESPVTRNWADPAKLTQNYAVLQCFAAKALNHRGLQRMEGA